MADLPPPPAGAVSALPPPPSGALEMASIDTKTGAPLGVRVMLSAIPNYGDKLKALQSLFPDAQPFEGNNFIFTHPATGKPTLFDEINPRMFNIPIPTMGDVADVGPELSEFVGGGVGGALAGGAATAGAVGTGGIAAPAVPAAVIGGTALGAAAGRELYQQGVQFATGAMGYDTRGVGERTIDATKTALVNGTGEMAGRLVAGAAGRLFRPGAETTQRLADATSAGVDPTPGMVARGVYPRIEQGLRSTLLGDMVRTKQNTAAGQLDDYATRTAQDLAQGADVGGAGVSTARATGSGLQSGARAANERVWQRVAQLDGQIERMLPGQAQVNVPNVAQELMRLRVRVNSAPETYGAALEPVIRRAEGILSDAARRGGITFDTLKTIRTELGKDLDPRKLGETPSAAERALQDLYSALRSDIHHAAASADPAAGRLMRVRDRYIRYFKEVNQPAILQFLEKKGGDTVDPEEAFKTFAGLARSNPTELARVWRQLGAGTRAHLSGGVLENLGRGANGDFSPALFLQSYEKLSPEAQRLLFSGDTTTRNAVDRLVRLSTGFRELAQRAGPETADKLAVQGGLATAAAMIGGVLDGSAPTAVAAFGAQIGAQYGAGRLWTSRTFLNWLAGAATRQRAGFQPESWAGDLGRLWAAMDKEDPETRDAAKQWYAALPEHLHIGAPAN